MLKETHFQIKGMSQDLAYQVFNSQYAFECKNIRINTTDENSLLSISNEQGNTEVATIEYKGDAVTIIGVGQFSEYCVLFGTTGEKDVILLVKQVEQDGEIIEQVEQVYEGNLGFSKEHPIRTICVYENEQMQKVYWIDGINPPRVLNIAGHLNEDSEVKKIENQKIDFLPKLKFEEKVTISRTSGGLFPAGVIQYAFTYSDKGLQESNLWYVSPLYYITQTSKGAEAGTTCNVAFRLDFSGIDRSFDYMQIYAIVRTSLNATPACYRIANIPTTTTSFTDTGSQWEACSADIILGKQLGTFVPNTIASKDSTLFLGNYTLKAPYVSKNDYETFFQNLANSTGIVFNDTYNSEDVTANLSKGSSSLQTFRSGEYYRLGIQFQDEYGAPSNVVYLKDFEADVADWDSHKFMQKIIQGVLPSIPDKLKKDFKRVRLLMVDRTSLPHKTICQGVLCPTVYSLSDRVNNAPFSCSSWCMRGYSGSKTDRPTWLPDMPLKNNLTSISAEVEDQLQYTGVFIGDNDEISDSDIIINTEADSVLETKYYYLLWVTLVANGVGSIGLEWPLEDRVAVNIKFGITTNADATSLSKDEIIFNGTSTLLYTLQEHYPDIYTSSGVESYARNLIYQSLVSHGAAHPNRIVNDLFSGWKSIDFMESFESNVYGTHYAIGNSFNNEYAKTSDAKTQTFEEAVSMAKLVGNPFFCDHNILTFHSPDVEKYQSIIDNNRNIQYRIVGYTAIENSYLDTYIQVNEPKVTGSQEGLQIVKKHSVAGIYNANLWKDDTLYPVYIWHRTNTLGEQKDSDDGKWYGQYSKKIMSNVHQCGYSYAFKNIYYPTYSIEEDVKFPKMGTPRVFNFDEVTALQLENQPYSKNIHDKLIYYGNVNDMHLSNAYYVPKVKDDSLVNSDTQVSDHCLIRYKSTPHVVMPMAYFIGPETDNGELPTYSPSLPSFVNREGAMIEASSYGYLWSSYTHGFGRSYLKDVNESSFPYSSDACFLYIAELYQDFKSSYDVYGGIDEESLSKHTWIPISDWVSLDTGTRIIGYGDCFIGRWECLKTYAFAEDDAQSYIDITSIILESDVNLESRYDNYKGIKAAAVINASKFNLFNPVYNQQNNLFNYRAFTNSENINNFQNQICWSEVKSLGEEIDTWCQINVGNNTDLQGEYGKLNGMITANNSLYCFQDNAIYKINYNTRVTISPSDGVPIQLTNNYRMDPPLLIKTDCGIQHQDCLSKSSNSIYFFDKRRKRIFTMDKDDNIIDLSGIKGVNSLLSTLGSIKNVLYDSNIKDIYFNFYNTSLCYNEDIAEFTSLYDYHHASNIFCLGANTYLIKDNSIYKQRSGEYSTFFKERRPYYIEILANDNPLISKTFTNVEFNMDPTYLGGLEEIFDFVNATTSYQEGGEILNVNKIKPSNIKRKFRIWRINLPRELGSMNRLRDRWCRIKLQNTAPSGNSMRLNYINVSYIPD